LTSASPRGRLFGLFLKLPHLPRMGRAYSIFSSCRRTISLPPRNVRAELPPPLLYIDSPSPPLFIYSSSLERRDRAVRWNDRVWFTISRRVLLSPYKIIWRSYGWRSSRVLCGVVKTIFLSKVSPFPPCDLKHEKQRCPCIPFYSFPLSQLSPATFTPPLFPFFSLWVLI